MTTSQVVTANCLRTGIVVYLDHRGRWVEALEAAAIATDEAALAHLETAAAEGVTQCEVTSVYAFSVSLDGDRPVPVSVRERIRAAHAPTI